MHKIVTENNSVATTYMLSKVRKVVPTKVANVSTVTSAAFNEPRVPITADIAKIAIV